MNMELELEGIELWNKKYLEPPPIASYKANLGSIDIFTLKNVFREALNTFKNQRTFNREAAFLSRFIYCLKTKLRHNKAMKTLQKINQILLRYLRVNIMKDFQIFMDMIPQNSTDSMYLPTRSMLQYLLVRLQGTAQLMVRLVETSKLSAHILNQYVSVGHLWKMLFLGFGIVSRIYILAKAFAKSCCFIYNQLLPFTRSLVDLRYNWLPADYVLPNDLEQWLNTRSLEEDAFQEVETQVLPYFALFNNMENDDDKWFEELNNIEKGNSSVIVNNNNKNVEVKVMEDLGIPVNNQTSEKKKGKAHKQPSLSGRVNSLKDLKKLQFNLRQNPEIYSDNFKKMDRMQCNILQKSLYTYIKKIQKSSGDSVKQSEYLKQAKKLLQCL